MLKNYLKTQTSLFKLNIHSKFTFSVNQIRVKTKQKKKTNCMTATDHLDLISILKLKADGKREKKSKNDKNETQ